MDLLQRRIPSLLLAATMLTAAVALGGCREEPDPPATPRRVELRDSAGVPVVRSHGPQWEEGERWTVAPEPRLVIGRADGDPSQILYSAGYARRLEHGGIIVSLTASPPELRIYSDSGELVRAIGGAGEGPGEFRALMRYCVQGDTVAAYDAALGRFTSFTLEGDLLDIRGTTPVMSTLEAQREVPVWMDSFAGCDFLGRPNAPRPERPGTASFAYSVLNWEDLSQDTIVVVAAGEWTQGVDGSGPREVAYSSFPWAVAGDSTLFVSDNADFWVSEYSLDGRLLRRFGYDHEPQPITTAQIERLEQRQLERAPPEQRSYLRERQATAVYADHWPAHTREMLVSRDGHLWIRHFNPPWEDPGYRRWSVFEPRGAYLGTVDTPSPLRITDIGSDYLLGIWRDEMDVESVRLFELRRGSLQ